MTAGAVRAPARAPSRYVGSRGGSTVQGTAVAAVALDAEVGRREARSRRYRLRDRASRVSALKSVQACGRSVRQDAGGASLVMAADGRAGWSGLNLCGSVSACVCCSARIREARAGQIDRAGKAHLAAGGRLAFLTLTMPHTAEHTLAELIAVQRAAWKAMRQDNAYRDVVKATGLRYVRAFEVTYTAAAIHGNGWHPHLHVLLFLDVAPTRDRLASICAAMHGPWAATIADAGYGQATQVDLQAVAGLRDAAGLVRYLAKVQEGASPQPPRWGIGREMARGDAKRAKRKRSRTPFQLLESACGVGPDGVELPAGPNWTDASRWHEYEAATKGLRVIESSRGLFAALLGTDEDPAALEQGAAPVIHEVARVPYDLWPAVVRMRYAARLLTLAETGGAVAVELGLSALRARLAVADAEAARALSAGDRAVLVRSALPGTVLSSYLGAAAQASRPAIR